MTTTPSSDLAVGRQGHYAGAASRLVAFALDLAAIWGLAIAFAALVAFTTNLVSGQKVEVSDIPVVTGVLFVAWAFVYFAYQWALSGRTIGMALLGLQVRRRNGTPAGARNAVVRTLALPLSFLCFGLGFLGILVHRERLALHDVLARTCVVYSWDARAARLRWLARHGDDPLVAKQPSPGGPAVAPGSPDPTNPSAPSPEDPSA